MLINKKKLEQRERKLLAPYAVLSGGTAGREFPEKIDPMRTEFQRDRDRIIHCKAFRRLKGKTQVFVAQYGDHYRDRLSHSLEVAQVARDIARSLALNEDLCEAIALAHDVGHTPFAHAGQEAMDAIMKKFDMHFEHNEQSKRVLEVLEKQFLGFDGLNLTQEVRDGLAKHQTLYDQTGKHIRGKTLEAQVVDIADEIAYHNHDIDDGLRAHFFTLKQLERLAIFRDVRTFLIKQHVYTDMPRVYKARLISQSMSLMIADCIYWSLTSLQKKNIKTVRDVLRQDDMTIGFSPPFKKKLIELRRFLWNNMYQTLKILRLAKKGQRVIRAIFKFFYNNPDALPPRFRARINNPDPLHIVVKDYIAGMTDAFACSLYTRYCKSI